jgi:hypothetical protein
LTSSLLRPKRHADVLLTNLDDETLLYHPEWMTAFALNSTASSIWQLCDGERTIAQIVELLQEAYPEEAATMPAEVEASVRTLSSHRVVVLPRLGPVAATFDVELGGATARIEADDAAAAKTLDFLCAAMATGQSAEGAVVFRLGPGTESGSIAVYRDDAVLYQDPSTGGASAFLLEKLQDHLVQHCTNGILLHAAAVARGGRSLLLAGGTGSGKTTLATWLVRRGIDYLTDELVWVDANSTRLHGFARPLHLKTEAGDLFAELFTPPGSDAVAETALGHHVSPLRLGADIRRDASPHILVFPRYAAGARFDFRPLSKAQAATHMMGCLVNARERTLHGFDEVTRLAHKVSAYSMIYSDLAEAGRRLESLLAS